MNKKTLNSFISYCETHQEQRFWQALRNWSREYYAHLGGRKTSHVFMEASDGTRIDTWELN